MKSLALCLAGKQTQSPAIHKISLSKRQLTTSTAKLLLTKVFLSSYGKFKTANSFVCFDFKGRYRKVSSIE